MLRQPFPPLAKANLRWDEREVPYAERSGGDGIVALAFFEVFEARELEILFGEREGVFGLEKVDKGAFGFPFVDWVSESEGCGRVYCEVELHARDEAKIVLDL